MPAKRLHPSDLAAPSREVQLKLMEDATRKRKATAHKATNHLFFARRCEEHGLPRPVWEFEFHPSRKFRADFAWPAYRVILELDGGLFGKKTHGAIAKLLSDRERDIETQLVGWIVLRIPWDRYTDDTTLELVGRAIAFRRSEGYPK
jgi:very-short-patch-repair endonuclease